jgi:hypothetical protein
VARASKPLKTQSAADLVADQIATKLFNAAQTSKKQKRPRRIPLQCEHHNGTEEALEWAAGDRLLPKSVRRWKEGALVVTDMVSQIMDQIRPRRLPALPSLGYNDPPAPVLKRLAAELDLEGALEPDWKLVELTSNDDELIFCLVPEDMDVADALQRYEAHSESQAAIVGEQNSVSNKNEHEGNAQSIQELPYQSTAAPSLARTVYGLDDAPPTAADYLDALKEVWPRLSPHAAEQMQAAFAAQVKRNGDITAGQMAHDLELKSHPAANGLYGRFARRIADELGLKGEPKQQWWPALSTCPGKDEHGHFIWRLRPTLQEALRSFEPTQDLFRACLTDATSQVKG